jgi:hypothetical protein
MITLITTLLFHVMAIHGVVWEGIGSAWIFSVVLDTFIFYFTVHCITSK